MATPLSEGGVSEHIPMKDGVIFFPTNTIGGLFIAVVSSVNLQNIPENIRVGVGMDIHSGFTKQKTQIL